MCLSLLKVNSKKTMVSANTPETQSLHRFQESYLMNFQSSLTLVLVLLGVTSLSGNEPPYSPLDIPPDWKAESLAFTARDSARNRDIPLRVYFPASKSPAPVILFSHGLGGSRDGNPYLGQHWSGRGYVVVFMQHAGSDEAVWRDAPMLQRMTSLKKAASLQNTIDRFKDVVAVIDELEKSNESADSALKGRLDLSKLGMSGHSFGAVTTQGVSGQRTAIRESIFLDPRIKASVIMSPSSPKLGDPKGAFGEVKIPWLLMTGTDDVALVGDTDVASRLAVFPALPPGNKYELVLEGGEHEAFGDRDLPGSKKKRNPNHHRVILALSTSFWDAYLKDDTHAKAWLDGTGPATILERGDRWQKK
jgi:predicted dienelactone hydrolase